METIDRPLEANFDINMNIKKQKEFMPDNHEP